MRAALFREHGLAAEVLTVEAVPDPVPAPGEVLVRVRRSGVNPTDWKQRLGTGERRPIGRYPYLVPNQDGSGEIAAVGAGVDAERIGQRVWMYFAAWHRQFGTAAELIALPSEQAVPLPDSVSFELGASLGIPALTAHRCLFMDGPITDKTVLVAGGAGAVGHFAIELATDAGARVLATASSKEKADLARAAGADAVVNYRDADAAEQLKVLAPHGVDRIVEVSLGVNFALDDDLLARDASLAVYATDGTDPPLAVGRLMGRNVSFHFVLVYTMPQDALAAAVTGVSDALGRGALSELPDHHYRLEAIADAHDAVESGAVGKVFVDL